MSKPRIPDDMKRQVISARVLPTQKAIMLEVGRGNLSDGLYHVLAVYSELPPALKYRPAVTTPTPATL
jgi:hypothetical protein